MQENIINSNNIVVNDHPVDESTLPLNRDELIEQLSYMIESIEKLPHHALYAPVTNADFAALIMILKALFKQI